MTQLELKLEQELDLKQIEHETDILIENAKQKDVPEFWMYNKGTHHYIPVKDGEIRVMHFVPEKPIGKRPIVFVPGWGGIPAGYADVYNLLHEKYELYYVETREKRSSHMHRWKAKFNMSQKARDVQDVINHFKLNQRDFVLVGACWGGGIVLQGLIDGSIQAPTVVTIDPMHSLWGYTKWFLRFVVPFIPVFLLILFKFPLRWAKLRKMTEVRQKERAIQFVKNAVMWKWKKSAYQVRFFELFGNLGNVQRETIVVNGTSDAIHNPEDYPKIAKELPKGRFLRLNTNERNREFLMGLIAGQFAEITQNDKIPQKFAKFELTIER
jgi:pimeloyl-ACP methyl ester carboxylesterase